MLYINRNLLSIFYVKNSIDAILVYKYISMQQLLITVFTTGPIIKIANLIIRVSIIWENNSIKFLLKASASIIWKKGCFNIERNGSDFACYTVTLIVMP
ncbi:hypothetical protein H8356DRAFT_1693918 [Neocallimastix lanati (nom. inval.)]|nr:hypothetical protein H8356DRAFT_1693918 [Neocallimastix sp. JGI-2020a]